MFNKEEFVKKFEGYSDEELLEIHSNIDGYSEEAQSALSIVINQKGGIENILQNSELKKQKLIECKKIEKEVIELGKAGFDLSFIKKSISSSILTESERSEFIEETYEMLHHDLADKRVTSKTVAKCVVGGIVASIVGGTLWGLQMIFSNAIFYIFGIGLALLCYGIIKLFTKQSKQNVAVFITTAISIVLSLVIGQLLFEIVGFIE